jgi:hypothetical protein
MAPRQIVLNRRVSYAAVLAAFVGLVILPDRAEASCSAPPTLKKPGALSWAAPKVAALTTPLRAGAPPAAVQNGNQGSGPITGLWQNVFLAFPNTQDEFIFDFGFQQFHTDGTELMISGGVPPTIGNVCIGVWERGAGGVITLRHVTWNWAGDEVLGDPPTGYFHLIVVLRTNDQGTAYTGTWRAASYDLGAGPLHGGPDVPQPGTDFSGGIQGVRIGVN